MMMMMNNNHKVDKTYDIHRRKRKLSDYLNELNLNDNSTTTAPKQQEELPGYWDTSRYSKAQHNRRNKKNCFVDYKRLRSQAPVDDEFDNDIDLGSKIAAETPENDASNSGIGDSGNSTENAENVIKIGRNMFIDRKYLDPSIGINSNNIQQESKRIYEKIMSERMNSRKDNRDAKRQRNEVNPLLEGRMSLDEFQKRFRKAYGDYDGDFEMESDRKEASNLWDKEDEVSNGEIVQRYYAEKNCALIVRNSEALDCGRVVWKHWQRWMRQQLVNEALKRVEEIHSVDDDDIKMVDIDDDDMLVEEA